MGKEYQARPGNGRQLASMIGNLPGMTYLCQNDENWTMEFVSDGCIELTGYGPLDLIGNRRLSYNDLIHPDDQLPVYVQIQEAVMEKRLFQLVYRIRTASGNEKWVWEQGMGVFSDKGDLLALAGFISDTINHKLVEKIESCFRALLEPYKIDMTNWMSVT